MAKVPAKRQTITGLIRDIKEEIEAGKQAAMAALENVKTTTYWNIGRKLDDYLAACSRPEEYNKTVIPQIAGKLEIGERTLYRSLQFHRQYPGKSDTDTGLEWSHFIILLSVKDTKLREKLEQRVLKERLSTRELEKLVKTRGLIEDNTVKKLSVRRGKPRVYKMETMEDEDGGGSLSCVDLGFRVYIKNPAAGGRNFPHETIVEPEKKNNVIILNRLEGDKYGLLYTYPAYITEIIDGDTVWFKIDLGFGVWTRQKIRLRGINAESPDTEEGRKAREFLEKKLGPCRVVVIKTYWRDKFDRFLGDIFYDPRTRDIYELAENGIFLNQEILDNQVATTY
ncbi:MAG: hypothetical protein JW969_18995 [Spirochaetales bacterium]|nr:hypothetical protein [Spirochaetales bacterium]